MIVFFFFKQKTAYEMRISDWSSDVCSSDSEEHHRKSPARALSGGVQVDFDYSDEQRLLRESVARFVTDRYAFEVRIDAMRKPEGWSRDAWRDMAEQNGRASCRETACKSV